MESKKRPPTPKATINKVAFIGDTHGNLKKALETSGVPAEASATSGLLVVDGATLTETSVANARVRVEETLRRHGTVFIWASPENIEHVNKLLPNPVSLTPTKATSLYGDREAPETAPIALADLFFADQSDPDILKYSLDGPLVSQSKILMESKSFSRRRFMSSEETKAVGLITLESGGGQLLITSLAPDVTSERRMNLMRSLYANLGVKLASTSDKYNTGFDGAGFLNQALLLGGFQGTLYPKILDVDFIGNESEVNPKPGDKVRDREWSKAASLGNGLFDFFRIGIPGTENSRARSQGPVLKPEALDANNYLEVIERVSGTNPGTNSIVYVSFWLYAHVPLINLN